MRDAYIVEIDVDSAVVSEDKVSDSVCALDRLRIIVKSVEEPWVLCSYKLSRLVVCPELESRID